MVSTRGIKLRFFVGERVLCYEPDPTKAKVLYDSKVLDIVIRKDQGGKIVVEYLIHFQGWNSSWDRCVGEEYVLKDTAENRQLQKDLAEKAQLQLGAYLYRKERKKHSQKPSEKATGSSEDGSSGSPARVDTDDIPEMSSSSDEYSSLEDEAIEIEIVPELREILEADYYLINGKNKRIKLPAEPNVITILESYYRHYATNQICGVNEKPNARYRNSFTNKDTKPKTEDINENLTICREVVDGLRIYFDFALNDLLLYGVEKGPGQFVTSPALMEPPGSSEVKIEVKNELNNITLENNSNNHHPNQNGLGDSAGNARRRTLRSNNKSESQTNGNFLIEESNGSSHPKPCSSVGSSNSDINGPMAKALSWRLIPEHVYSQQPPPPSLVYGAIHFTRLFVKLPELFSASSIPEIKMKIILRHVDSIVESLQWAFRYLCIKRKEIERNNVLAILLSLMEIYPDLLSGNLTFAYDIAMLAMSRDIEFKENWTSSVKLTTSSENHSCMALLLMCISYFPNCLSGPKIIEECRIVMGLLKLIGHQQAIRWHQLQACYLIRLALNILQKIIPASTEEFIEDGGPLTIIQLLNRSRQSPNSYNYDIVYRSLEILAHLSFKFISVRDSVAYNGGVSCITPLLEDYLDQPYLSLHHQLLIGNGICLLEQICTCGEVYIVLPMLIKYMKRYIEPNEVDPIQNPKLIIVILSFIWTKVAHSDYNCELFVGNGGVYLILDILQKSCSTVRLVGLGALIELCERVECIPYIITWRKNGQRIKSLLADIFRQENKDLSVKTENDGILADPYFPIMGRAQFYETFCSCKRTTGSPAIGDMFASARVKVYCMLQILNHKQHETVKEVDEFYRLYDEDLSAQDEIVLLLAENYLALKLAEEWKELEKDFEKMGLEAIPTDDATILAMIQITNQWGIVLQNMQIDVLQKHQMREARKEQDLYTDLKNSCLSDAWDAICQMRYIARCSERLFRISSSFNVQNQITKSLNVNAENGPMHRTLPSRISISCLDNQNITVPTDVYVGATSFVAYSYSPEHSQISIKDRFKDESKFILKDKFLSKRLVPQRAESKNANKKKITTFSVPSISEKKTS